MKRLYTALLVVNRSKWLLMGLALTVALLFPHQGAAAGQEPVNLGSASSFAVLAGTQITGNAATTIEGNVGVSPAGAITGITPGMVSGTIHTNDPIAAQAQLDLVTAFDDAAGRTIGAIPHLPVLGDGEILPPGLYTSNAAYFSITGNLTLDAQGDPDAVWIFQMSSTLLPAASSQVILINGARSRNIFWQIGSAATLGANAVLAGNLLALEAITMGAGARLDGRALVQHTFVTLDANAITKKGLYSDQPWRILFMD